MPCHWRIRRTFSIKLLPKTTPPTQWGRPPAPLLHSSFRGIREGTSCMLEGHHGLFPFNHRCPDLGCHAGCGTGLGCMPPVASLILAPDEALRPDARCPWLQCRVTADLAACMGHIGNSLSQLLLGLLTSLQQAQVELSLQILTPHCTRLPTCQGSWGA